MSGKYKTGPEKAKNDTKKKTDDKNSESKVTEKKPAASKKETSKSISTKAAGASSSTLQPKKSKIAFMDPIDFDDDSDEEGPNTSKTKPDKKHPTASSTKTVPDKTVKSGPKSGKTKASSDPPVDKSPRKTKAPPKTVNAVKSVNKKVTQTSKSKVVGGMSKIESQKTKDEGSEIDMSVSVSGGSVSGSGNGSQEEDEELPDVHVSNKQALANKKLGTTEKSKAKVLAYPRKSGSLGSNGKVMSSTPKPVKKGSLVAKASTAGKTGLISVAAVKVKYLVFK